MLKVKRDDCVNTAVVCVVNHYDTRDDYEEAQEEIYQLSVHDRGLEEPLPEGLIICKGYLIGSLYRICDFLYDLGAYQKELERLDYTQEDIYNGEDITTAIQNVVLGFNPIIPYGFEDGDLEPMEKFGVDPDVVEEIVNLEPRVCRYDFWTKSRIELYAKVRARLDDDPRMNDIIRVMIAAMVLRSHPLKSNLGEDELFDNAKYKLKDLILETIDDVMA